MDAQPVTFKQFIVSTAVAIAPVLVVMLISKPALRQKITMTAVKAARDFAIWQTEVWREASFSIARIYDRVRM